MKHCIFLVLTAALTLSIFAAGMPTPKPLPTPRMESPYAFTDGTATVILPDAFAGKEITYSIKTITDDGWGKTDEGKIKATADAKIAITPLVEGIHIVTLQLAKPAEVRFLAIYPPAKASATEPSAEIYLSTYNKLAKKEKFVILVMGDSVTDTGDYAGMLAMLLKRATGNDNIEVVKRAFSGRSVDATVRTIESDIKGDLGIKPDLGLIMYGLNDQAGGCSLDGFIDQNRWIAETLKNRCGTDMIFLTPTPDLSLDKDTTVYGAYTLRTFAFGDALKVLGNDMKIPVADTFHALWSAGAPSIDASAHKIWPRFPLGYSNQLSSMLESNGKGDGIHPGALGHLAIAWAVFNTIMGPQSSPVSATGAVAITNRTDINQIQPISFSAVSSWTPTGMVSNVTMTNNSKEKCTGNLTLYPFPDGEIAPVTPIAYDLAPSATKTFTVTWPKLLKPEDLLTYPYNLYLTTNQPIFAAFDSSGNSGYTHIVRAPMEINANFLRQRIEVKGNSFKVTLNNLNKKKTITVKIPKKSDIGRIPLVYKVKNKNVTGWAVAEAAYIRYGKARIGDATVDGDLAEYKESNWITIGDPIQARWTQGIRDGRINRNECDLRWAFSAGKNGIYFAVDLKGTKFYQDNFTIFMDTRKANLLGTPGPYYWISGRFDKNDKLSLSRGETSPNAPGLAGVWKANTNGANLEFFVPYAMLGTITWPTDGDFWMSIWWRHTSSNPEAKYPSTNLLWSEDGQPWSTRWYGVIRADDGKNKPLPFMVRIK